jgi:triacylglycerol lipase
MATGRTVAHKRPRRRDRPPLNSRDGPFIWREALWPLDWLWLRLSPIYLGLGVPHGDRGPVILVPAFMTTDAYLLEMYFWLQRMGYTPFLSGIGVNAGCIRASTRRLEKTVDNVYAETGRPIHIIGHSLGGSLARRVALQRPDIIAQLISLGSPLQSLQAHPALMAPARLMGERIQHTLPPGGTPGRPGVDSHDGCECLADHCVPIPPPSIRRAALYTRNDGVVYWRDCLDPDPSLNHEVGGTHFGLVFNPTAYRVIANLLPQGVRTRRRRAA